MEFNKKTTNFRTNVAKVMGIGSANDGVHHWWMQKFTALALIPLVMWFVITCISLTISDDEDMVEIIRSPFNLLFMILFLITTIYHGMLGVKIVIEDYIHKHSIKIFLLVIMQMLSIVSVVAAILAVVSFYFSVFI